MDIFPFCFLAGSIGFIFGMSWGLYRNPNQAQALDIKLTKLKIKKLEKEGFTT